jgi:hypothetical protein
VRSTTFLFIAQCTLVAKFRDKLHSSRLNRAALSVSRRDVEPRSRARRVTPAAPYARRGGLRPPVPSACRAGVRHAPFPEVEPRPGDRAGHVPRWNALRRRFPPPSHIASYSAVMVRAPSWRRQVTAPALKPLSGAAVVPSRCFSPRRGDNTVRHGLLGALHGETSPPQFSAPPKEPQSLL